MTERLGMIVTIAFIVTRFRFFRQMLNEDTLNRKQQINAILFFGVFGIIGTYTGLTLSTDLLEINRWVSTVGEDEAIANSRVIGVVLAGLFGGWRIGLGAGLVAGLHRFSLGGFTALSCGVATIIAGLLAGLFYKKNKHVKLSKALMIGALAESIQMLIILLVSKPFGQALSLVEHIGIPMIIANGLGSALFLLIIKSVLNEEEKAAALQAQKSLRIARKTLGHMRQGMNEQSAAAVCRILFEEVKASAIAITHETKILAHIGLGDDHHSPGRPLQTGITRQVIEGGELIVVGKRDIHCQVPNCPLGAVIIGPLKKGNKTVGTLKLYFRNEKEINNVDIELMSGLSMLLSYQLEVSQLDEVHELAREAEIRALQAQINPHFLFNALNTIVSLTRVDQTKARKMLLSLSQFFRQNLAGTTAEWTTLSEELQHLQSYANIEKMRFVDKLQIRYEVDEEALTAKIPPLTLQPLIENAIHHGFKNKTENCLISIQIKNEVDTHIGIVIRDNGTGIDPEQLQQLGLGVIESKSGTGIALYNVNKRLTMKLGEESALHIQSEQGKGTEISLKIPK
ncbi:LytS/YhcK type 5TM receptor domain-containing protein [Peribacillus sp. NPDC096540]|uniref:LytS/YhcK type 5TM receptor domain-containing protein n=1 Tax=Peribacillus sp. NPDC096540 TaxID=3390612 RepID=UPI003CFCF2E1